MRTRTIATRAAIAAAVATISLSATSAQAKDYQIRLSAFVPTSCSANIEGTVGQIDADTFSLGHINQFCNTRFQLSLNHGMVSRGSQFNFGGDIIPANGDGSTVLKALSAPVAYGRDELLVSGFNADQASELGSTLTVTVSPIGF